MPAMSQPIRPRTPRQPATRSLWEEAMGEVAARNARQTAARRRTVSHRASRSEALCYAIAAVIVFALTLGWFHRDMLLSPTTPLSTIVAVEAADRAAEAHSEAQDARAEEPATDTGMHPSAINFTLCHSGGGSNCVVDGDTFWLDGEKIRIADIDTPETHPPRCAREAELGERATLRLQQLLSAAPVTLSRAPGGNSHDRYGRRLAIVERGGVSIGMMLVSEGLARPYAGGQRDGWC